MNCKKCGFILEKDNAFCPNCGEPNEFFQKEQSVVEPTPVAPVEPVQQPVVEPAPVVPVEPVEQPVVEPAPVAPVEPVEQPVVEPAPVAPVEPVEQPVPGPAPVINTMNTAPVPQKKSNVGFIILVIALGLIIVGLGVFICIKLFGGNNNSSVKNDTPINNSTEPTPVNKQDEDLETVEFKGVTFTLPSDVVTEEVSTGQMFSNITESYVLIFQQILNGDFNTAKSNFSANTTALEAAIPTATYNGILEKTIDNQYYYYADYTYNDDGTKAMIYITKLPNNLILCGVGVYYIDEIDTVFDKMTSIVKSAKTSNNSFVESSDNELKIEFPTDITIKK